MFESQAESSPPGSGAGSEVSSESVPNSEDSVMIGEMWDLERLCEKAQALGRWTCFVSSVPLKVSVSSLETRAVRLTWALGSWWCCEPAQRIGYLLAFSTDRVSDADRDTGR